LPEVAVKVPKGVDVEEVKRRIEAFLGLVISDEFDEFIEYLEEYALQHSYSMIVVKMLLHSRPQG